MNDKNEPGAFFPSEHPVIESRAERLQREAANCIALAVDAAGDPFAGELLNEAIKLWTRARARSKG